MSCSTIAAANAPVPREGRHVPEPTDEEFFAPLGQEDWREDEGLGEDEEDDLGEE